MLLSTVCDAAPKFQDGNAAEDKFCCSGAGTFISFKLEHAPTTMAKFKLEHTTSTMAIISHSVYVTANIWVALSWLLDWLEAQIYWLQPQE